MKNQDYNIVVEVRYDSFGQRSLSVSTCPEGVPAEDVNGVIKLLAGDGTEQ